MLRASCAALQGDEEEEDEDDEAEADAAAAAAAALETDWKRGRRLKKLYQMMHSKQALVHYTRYIQHSYAILGTLVAVHTIMFVVRGRRQCMGGGHAPVA